MTNETVSNVVVGIPRWCKEEPFATHYWINAYFSPMELQSFDRLKEIYKPLHTYPTRLADHQICRYCFKRSNATD